MNYLIRALAPRLLDITTVSVGSVKWIQSRAEPLLFRSAQILCLPEPLKKKKRTSPEIQRAKDDRKTKKLEKEIKQLKKHARKPKPIDEMLPDMKLVAQLESRKRSLTPMTFEESERIALLYKDWSRFKGKQHWMENRKIQQMIAAQTKALRLLREESEDLYQAAIKVDQTLLPYERRGPVTTPPIPNYNSPDGEYVDTTRKWE